MTFKIYFIQNVIGIQFSVKFFKSWKSILQILNYQ